MKRKLAASKFLARRIAKRALVRPGWHWALLIRNGKGRKEIERKWREMKRNGKDMKNGHGKEWKEHREDMGTKSKGNGKNQGIGKDIEKTWNVIEKEMKVNGREKSRNAQGLERN